MRLILTALLLCCGLAAQSPIVQSFPFMTDDGTPAIFARDADGGWIVQELSGFRIAGRMDPEEDDPPSFFEWELLDGKETWRVTQNCAKLSAAECLRRFMAKVKSFKRILKEQGIL